MPANYVLIGEQTTNATVSSVTFSNIPQTGYSDLKIVVSARSNAVRDDDYATIALNGVTTDQSARVIYGTGSANGSVAGTPVSTPICAANNTANTFGNSEVYIPNYTSNTNKAFTQVGVLENNATWAVQNIGAGLWSPSTSAPITSIVFSSTYGSFVAGSTFSMYGIAAFGTTPTAVPKASGGDIITNDGTYWYHQFLSSGVFIPNQSLSCDFLVIAGGGGGAAVSSGGNYSAPGGGAGGYRTSVGTSGGGGSAESALSLLAQQYAVTVGAGGTSNLTGSNSVFATITSAGGGGTPNGNGGSGGGAFDFGTLTPGSGTANQGFAGAAAASSTSAGGGGGAGSVGSSARTGGAGITSSISGASVARAGGGGAGWGGTATAGGGAGGAASTTQSGSAGTINTGGGGGGASVAGGSASGGAGGSGIVVIRYAMA
jgi:hypothetical protein